MASKTSLQDIGDRKLKGDTASALFKSRQEAPDVEEYDYEKVEIQAFDGGATDMNDFVDQYTSTLFEPIAKNVEIPSASIEVLLNDAWICIRIDDGPRLLDILNTLNNEFGLMFPADTEFGEMFKSTLWERITDPEVNLPPTRVRDCKELLEYFHQ